MKKAIALAFSLLFVLVLFVCGDKEIKVTEKTVKGLAKSAIEADFYSCNSYFYDIEKDANGVPVSYPTDETNFFGFFKITTPMTIDELNKSAEKYQKGAELTTERFIAEKDGELYAMNIEGNLIETMLDINSIRLVRQDGDIYYVAADQYMYVDGYENEDGSPNYINTYTYKMKAAGGILQIQDPPEIKEESPLNTGKDIKVIGSFDKFFGPVNEREYRRIDDKKIEALAKRSIESGFYLARSYYYDVEKDENGKPVEYKDITDTNDEYLSYFKITTAITEEEIEKYAEKYQVGFEKFVNKDVFVQKDGNLYVQNLMNSTGEEIFDLNSVKLKGSSTDGYYISVDVYGDLGRDSLEYSRTYIYRMEVVNGVLQIQNSAGGCAFIEKSKPVNSEGDRNFIGSFDKFLGRLSERK